MYRARDTRLNRDVALKVLPESFAADPERLARFTREAQTLALLNHPNIAQIHGLEDADGVRALVMELVEGEDLSQRIARGALPLDEAVPIARQIAEALEAAHEQGIVHRDLKPANVKVRSDGTVKVLDYGLAKAFAPSGGSDMVVSQALTITTPAMTQAGMILGTAAYMAPEQARGRAVDRGADLWAFGCVLFELLTGRRAFEGEDVTETLAAIVKSEPPWALLPAGTPVAIRTLLRQCLQKQPQARLRDGRSARLALDEALAEPAPVAARGGAREVPSARARWRWALGGVALAAVALLAIAGWLATRAPAEEPSREFQVALPPGAIATSVAMSPDGRRLVLKVQGQGVDALMQRSMESAELQPLAGTAASRVPFVSPDGRVIGFFGDNYLQTMPAGGGPPQRLCSEVGLGAGGTWNADGVILFGSSTSRAIERVSADGGPCTTVIAAPKSGGYRFPTFLPDGRHFLYVAQTDDVPSGIYIAALDAPTGTRLLPDVSSALFAPRLPGNPRGHLLFLRGGVMMAVAFDATRRVIEGDAVEVARNASFSSSAPQMAAAVTDSGLLVFGQGGDEGVRLTWIDRGGKKLETVGEEGFINHVALSPDARNAVIVRLANDERAGTRILWLVDLLRAAASRLAEQPRGAVWSPDGARIASGKENALLAQDLEGGETRVLFEGKGLVGPSDWSADGKWLVYTQDDPKTRADMSPDGTRVAYAVREGQTRRTGLWMYDIQRAIGSRLTFDARVDGNSLVWAPDGRSLLTDPTGVALTMLRVPVDGVGKAEPLLASDYSQSAAAWSPRGDAIAFFEARDGRRRLLVGGLDGSEPVQVGQDAFTVRDPEFSPDGRWLAYASNDSGADEVYVQPHRGPGARVRVSTDRGIAPVWSRTGRELFYARGSSEALQMMVVDVDLGDGFRAGSPRQLFDGPYQVTVPIRSHDVTADGKKFVMIRPAGDREPPFTQMRVVFNWVEELKRLTAR